MRNHKALMATAIGFLLFIAGVIAQETKVVLSGKDVYAKKCASCHGKAGEGVASVAKMLKTKISDLRGRPVTADTLVAWKKITIEGKGKMPGKVKSKLTDAEIDSALIYMQLLAKAPSGGAKTDSSKGTAK